MDLSVPRYLYLFRHNVFGWVSSIAKKYSYFHFKSNMIFKVIWGYYYLYTELITPSRNLTLLPGELKNAKHFVVRVYKY